MAAGEEALEIARQLDAPSRVAFAAAYLAGRVRPINPRRAEELLTEAAEAGSRARNDWAECVIPEALIVMHGEAGGYRAAAETTMQAAGTWAGRRAAGIVAQFAAILACVLTRLGDDPGAQVLAAWSIGRGIVIPTDHPYWIAYDSQELMAARQRLSDSELERLVRSSARMDERAIARLGRERLSHVAE